MLQQTKNPEVGIFHSRETHKKRFSWKKILEPEMSRRVGSSNGPWRPNGTRPATAQDPEI